MLSKARGCNALATSLEMQQIRDAPLVMHQDHSESLGLHVAQRINCYKLPRKLPQIRSAQHHGENWVVFENPQHDFPKRIEYRRDGTALKASISGPGDDGKILRIPFDYRRCGD